MDHYNYQTLVKFYNLIYTPLCGIFDREFFLGRNRSGCQSTLRCLLSLLLTELVFGIAWALALIGGQPTAWACH